MTSPELVIFDCDGVLVDSEVVGTRVDQRVLADLGWELTIDEIVSRFVGGTDEHFQRVIEEFRGEPLPAGWEAKYAGWYHDAFERELTPIDGIERALHELTVPWCVASNNTHPKIRHSLSLTGLIDHFDGRIFSSEDVAAGKPDPALFLHAAETMGVAPARCVVVEDSRYGVQAARAAGMRVFGYAGGLTPAEALEGPATTVFYSMDELPRLVGDL